VQTTFKFHREDRREESPGHDDLRFHRANGGLALHLAGELVKQPSKSRSIISVQGAGSAQHDGLIGGAAHMNLGTRPTSEDCR